MADQEALTIFSELHDEPNNEERWMAVNNPNASVFRTLKEGKPFVCIYLAQGGWLGCYLEDMQGDIAPFCG